METIVRTLARDEILSRLAGIVAIYREAFEPFPYLKGKAEVEDFARSFPDHLENPGFRFAAAFQGNNALMVGFAYGRASIPGQYWYQVVRSHLEPVRLAGWLKDSFQVVEMAVVPAWQGRGAGGRLHDRLLEGAGYSRAVLTTLDGQTAASYLYQNRGWQLLAGGLRVPGLPRAYKVMGLDLARQKEPAGR